jgi:hypothetical protein
MVFPSIALKEESGLSAPLSVWRCREFWSGTRLWRSWVAFGPVRSSVLLSQTGMVVRGAVVRVDSQRAPLGAVANADFRLALVAFWGGGEGVKCFHGATWWLCVGWVCIFPTVHGALAASDCVLVWIFAPCSSGSGCAVSSPNVAARASAGGGM